MAPRRALGLGCVTLALCAAIPTVSAAQSRIRTEVDTTLVNVGDRITMTVSVEHDPGTRVAWPDSLTLSPFEVLDGGVLPPKAVGERTVSTLRLSVAAFELGELEIPSFEVAVLGPGEEVEVLDTDRYGVEVVTVGADETGDIREIRGPLAIAVSALRLAGIGIGLLVLAGLLFVLYRRYRSRGGEDETAVRGPPPRAAHELALEALGALEASPLLGRGQVKEYHIEVSEILRTYVERRFRVDALEMTTLEVITGLEDAGVDGGFTEGFRRFLDQCDLVKFAKVRPSDDASREVLALGRKLVEDTIAEVPIPDVDVAEVIEEVDAEEAEGGEESPVTAAGVS